MTAFIRNLESRFGRTEVESWRFEVWNEPNLDGFWTHGDQQAYFRLQHLTRDVPETSLVVHVDSSGAFRRQIPIRTNDILLVRLTWLAAARSSGIRPGASQPAQPRVTRAAPIENRSARRQSTSRQDAPQAKASGTPT